MKSIEEVFADIEEARRLYRPGGEIFLIDGNVMALKTEKLPNILKPKSLKISSLHTRFC